MNKIIKFGYRIAFALFFCTAVISGCTAGADKSTASPSYIEEDNVSIIKNESNDIFTEPSYIIKNADTAKSLIKETGSFTTDGEALLQEYGFRPDMPEAERRRWCYSLSAAYQELTGDTRSESEMRRINPYYLRDCENEFVDFSTGLVYRIEEMKQIDRFLDYPSEAYISDSLGFLESGGTVKETYLRIYQDESGTIKEEIVPQATVEVRITVKNTTDFDVETTFTPRLLILKDLEGCMTIWWPSRKYKDATSKSDGIFRFYMDSFPFYLDTPLHNEKKQKTEFFHFRVPAKQEQEVKVCYLVDLDYCEELYLYLNFSGMDYSYDNLDTSLIPLRWEAENK